MIYDVLFRNLIDTKPMRFIFSKVDEFIRDYDGVKNLVLFGPEKHDAILDNIRCQIRLKRGITYVFFINMQMLKLIQTMI